MRLNIKNIKLNETITHVVRPGVLLNVHINKLTWDETVDNFYSIYKINLELNGSTVWMDDASEALKTLGAQLIDSTKAYYSIAIWADEYTDNLERIYDEYYEIVSDTTHNTLLDAVNEFISDAVGELQ